MDERIGFMSRAAVEERTEEKIEKSVRKVEQDLVADLRLATEYEQELAGDLDKVQEMIRKLHEIGKQLPFIDRLVASGKAYLPGLKKAAAEQSRSEFFSIYEKIGAIDSELVRMLDISEETLKAIMGEEVERLQHDAQEHPSEFAMVRKIARECQSRIDDIFRELEKHRKVIRELHGQMSKNEPRVGF